MKEEEADVDVMKTKRSPVQGMGSNSLMSGSGVPESMKRGKISAFGMSG